MTSNASKTRKRTKLHEMRELFDSCDFKIEDVEDVTVLRDLRIRMSEISDPRDSAYVRHELGDIIVIALLAVMSNADEWMQIEIFAKSREKWLKTFLRLENGIPCDDTFRTVISSLNINYVYAIAIKFFMKKLDEIVQLSGNAESCEKDIKSFDGKTSRGSGRNETDVPGSPQLHTLNVYSSNYAFCIAQEFVGEKTNEITSMPKILRMLDLRNSIATWDALNTQKDIVKAVIDGKGDYVAALKGNHPNLYQDVVDYFEPKVLAVMKEKPEHYDFTKESEHSAVVTREYFLETNIKWLYDRKDWAGLKSIGVVRKTISPNNPNKPTVVEMRYYICSVTDVKDFAMAVREHWGVENGLHWQMDFTFKDDKNTTMAKNGAKGLQILKKLALAILKMAQCVYPKRTSVKSIRYRLCLSFEAEILRIFSALNPQNLRSIADR